MSYQVLARKWRPQTFSELVGQQHVVDAITNALENDKLHHAYLFTGTRGVGKTTIARIFSKSLNCEQGQSANPCGQCATCQDISDGRYVDLLEIDAASRTKVEDTRELLDNVQYRPTRGKYKVYLIDEVHMLSKHSFNALLKTLEEPPEHVKFLLATTDPQKLPVTILSRCLQFSLKALSKQQIQAHLAYILTQEKIQYEAPALAQLARAAQGSIRDSLSLTDQAIAQGNNQVSLNVVASMLGLLNKNQILKLVKFICERESAQALGQLDDICSQSPDYFQVLSQTLALLHQIALTQVIPEICKLEGESAKGIYTLANSISKEHVQILYQIGINGKRDLPHAPDPRSGLQMTVLRMLAFSPMQKIDLDVDALINQEAELAEFESLQKPSVPALAPVAALSQKSLIDNHTQRDNTPTGLPASPELEFDVEVEKNTDKETPVPIAPVISASDIDVQHVNAEHSETNDKQQYSESMFEPAQEPRLQKEVETVETKPQPLAQTADLEESSDINRKNIENAVDRQGEVASKEVLAKNEQKPASDDFSDQVPAYFDEQPPLPDEEPPIYDDMFADQLMSNEESSSHAPEDAYASPAQTLGSQIEPQDNTDAEKLQIDQTRELLKVSQQLNKFTVEKQEEEAAKKPETETPTTPVVVASSAYQLGHEFATFDGKLSAYLDTGIKLSLAAQVDEWSAFVDTSKIVALARQLLIHANCKVLCTPLVLTIPEQITHLCEDAIIQKIQEQLSEHLAETIVIELKFGETENTPFQIQTRIDKMRQDYAHEVVNTDNSIQELIKAFSATVIEDSVEAR